MAKIDNIFLIGPMGSGKSSIGVKLAKLAKLEFFDSDMEIIRRTGVDISWIFEMESEAGFRKREVELIKELSYSKNIVLSTGGGTIVMAENREQLKHHGVVVYLCVSLDKQLDRTSRHQVTRPLLEQHPDPRSRLIELNKEREPLYSEIADLTYNTDSTTPAELAKQIWQDVLDFRKTLE
ncbi:MAG: shikimate kinase AroK [Gammaproteobacteria bacterium]|nr:shikimate kinase AroK [Gammaproteobacteria bacterium]